jgi:hypothetical protein
VFDAQQPAHSAEPLVFDPTGKCPAFVVNPKIARPALEKQHADDVEYAQLVKDNVSVVPIYSGLDGGMNKVFLAQFPGSIIPLARVLLANGYQLPQMAPIPYADNDGSVASRLFGSVFRPQPASQTRTLSLIRPTLEGEPKATAATKIESVAAKPTSGKPSTNEAARNESPKTEAQ